MVKRTHFLLYTYADFAMEKLDLISRVYVCLPLFATMLPK
jgi:hypothetical protein